MALALVLTAACFLSQAAVPFIEMRDGSFVVVNWTPPSKVPPGGWSSVLEIYAGGAGSPHLVGAYKVDSGVLTFHPRYPLTPGVRVRTVFKGKEQFFELPRPKLSPTARVVRVYPTSSTLPENQLKFYIEFSEPMSQGEAWKHLRLLDGTGKVVDQPFLEIDQEMWDGEGRRLTVLFDPGRIKRGVKPLEDVGPSIEAGNTYTLLVNRDWIDARGAPMVDVHRKVFKVTDADRTPIETSEWRIGTVRAGARDPLIVDFPEPLDAALAMRLIRVDDVEGTVELASEERQWRFVPKRPWGEGPHTLKVDATLEDLAGNKVGVPFDVDTFDRVGRRVLPKLISIPVRVSR